MTAYAGWLPPALGDVPGDPDGRPALLAALLGAVRAQQEVLEADIDQLWDDMFVDSCADWALPYLGALLGLPPDAERLEIAYAVALRRRKGTPAALEDFAEVVTGLTARVVEGWQVTTCSQRLGQPWPLRPAAVSLRDDTRLRLGTPFSRVRRSVRPAGPSAPAAVTAVVWPWTVQTLVAVGTAPVPAPAGVRRYALHPLGIDAPMYLRPRPLRLGGDGSEGSTRTGDETDAPVRATYRLMQALARPGEITYGAALTLADSHPLATGNGGASPLLRLTTAGTTVPWSDLRFGSVPGTAAAASAPPGPNEVLVDVARGRVELGSARTGSVRATWHRAVSGEIGALASRVDASPAARVVVSVDPDGTGPRVVPTLADAFSLAQTLSAALDPDLSQPGVPDVEIRLLTSDRLAAPPPQSFAPAVPRWRVVAPPLLTPTVIGDLALDLVGGCVELAGFFLRGDLLLGPALDGVHLDGVTMDPDGAIGVDPAAWELELSARRCVLAPIRADLAAYPLVLTDCVVDGRRRRLRPCGGDPVGLAADAVAPAARFGPRLQADSVTFAGPVRVEAAQAVDCVFVDGVEVVQVQEGCLRHCVLGPPLSTPPAHPPTYRCGPFPPPAFASEGFDAAGYYRIDPERDSPLLHAASDGGEVGAHHRARRGARIARLRERVEEFVPLGLRAAVTVAAWEER